MTQRRFAPHLVPLEPRSLMSAVAAVQAPARPQPPPPEPDPGPYPGQFYPGFQPSPVMDPSFTPTSPTGPGGPAPTGPAGTDLPPSSPLSPPPTLLC